jgi:hypothetical protein
MSLADEQIAGACPADGRELLKRNVRDIEAVASVSAGSPRRLICCVPM